MKLHSLTARNFMPYKGEMELTFPQDEQRNVMIVFGDNMRGKTSILNAIRWAFYGEALGRHSRPIRTSRHCQQRRRLGGRLEGGSPRQIRRQWLRLRSSSGRRPQAAGCHALETRRLYHSQIHLTRDGSVVSGDQVDAEIGLIAPKQISRFFLFDGELLQEYETLLIEDSQQGQQIKEAIEQVLGVPALTNGRVDVQTILKHARKDVRMLTSSSLSRP